MSQTETAIESPADLAVRERWTAYAAWAADTLGLRLEYDGQTYRLKHHEGDAASAAARQKAVKAGRSWLLRTRPPATPGADKPVFEACSPTEVIETLGERLNARATPPSACPAEQPTAVHHIAQRLLDAYTLDGGVVHVAGCRLEDRPIVRLTQLDADTGSEPALQHTYYDAVGKPLDPAWIAAVGADRLAPLPHSASKIEHRIDPEMIDRARAADAASNTGPDASEAVATVLWVKHAAGVLRFDFAEESIDTPFAGWASTVEAPPVVCPTTGVETFHLATVEGGAICAADQIGACVKSGHRRPRGELTECSVTGGLAEPEWLAECSLTKQPVLKEHLVTCPRCGERVAPSAMVGDVCSACAKPKRLPASDPRVERVVASRTSLTRRRWVASETPSVLVLEATSWFRRRVVTVDRDTLDIKHAAEASRFSPVWRRLPIDEI
ncbi:MAG: hypothetical protein AAFV43_14745 [Planctomycetota bacterium]